MIADVKPLTRVYMRAVEAMTLFIACESLDWRFFSKGLQVWLYAEQLWFHKAYQFGLTHEIYLVVDCTNLIF